MPSNIFEYMYSTGDGASANPDAHQGRKLLVNFKVNILSHSVVEINEVWN